MITALYMRVSTDDQNLDPQSVRLREYCALRNFENPVEFVDKISGGKFTRIGLDSLMDHVYRGKVKRMVVVKLDRIGRSFTDLANVLSHLQTNKVALVCTDQGIDTTDDNPTGNLQLHILSAVAHFEKALIKERTLAGLEAARQRGVILGRPEILFTEDQIQLITDYISKKEGAPQSLRQIRDLTGISVARVHMLCKKVNSAWDSMKQRCLNPNSQEWDNYGGRGIKVHQPWETSFEDFISSVKVPESLSMSLDRWPDTNGNYQPDNVRWAYQIQQINGRRNTNFHKGIPVQVSKRMHDAKSKEEKLEDFRAINARINQDIPRESI